MKINERITSIIIDWVYWIGFAANIIVYFLGVLLGCSALQEWLKQIGIFDIQKHMVSVVSVVIVAAGVFFESKAILIILKSNSKYLRDKIQKQQQQINVFKQNFIEIIEANMLSLARDKLNIMVNSSDSFRLSLFYCDEKKSNFRHITRVSNNSALRNSGRFVYPHGEGCLWEAYQHGKHFNNSIPDYRNRQQYYEYMHNNYHMSQQTCDNLRMHPTLIYGYRINKRYKNVPLCIIIIESTNRCIPLENNLDSLLDNEKNIIRNLVEPFEEYIPDITLSENLEEIHG